MIFQYPLDEKALRVFRDRFHQEFNTTLFYVSDSFINACFLEFSDQGHGNQKLLVENVLFTVASAEDSHCLDRDVKMYTAKTAAQQKLCPRCHGSGFHAHTFCERCQGSGRVERAVRSHR